MRLISCPRLIAATAVLASLGVASLSAAAATATSNISPTNKYAWGENIGWINFNGQGTGPQATPPPFIGANYCAGFAWAENVGWINLGDGSPSNGVSYSQAAGDTGVNVSPTGALTGFAWGENIGWLNFSWTPTDGGSTAQRPFVNTTNGRFVGFVWGENVGWINLNGSTTGGPTARPEVIPPTALQIANGLAKITDIPLRSNLNADGVVDAADIVTRVNQGP